MASRLVVNTAPIPAKSGLVTAIFAAEGAGLAGEAAKLWSITGLDFARLAAAAKFAGKAGQVIEVLAPSGVDCDRLLVIGIGSGDAEAARKPNSRRDFGGSLYSRLAATRSAEITLVADDTVFTPDEIGEIVAGMQMKAFRFDRYKTRNKLDDENTPPETTTITFAVSEKRAADKSIAHASALVEGTLLARELIHEPPNALGPVELAEHVRELTKIGIDVDILTVDEMEKLGMGALLAVGKGSARPSRLAIMQWHGGRKGDAPLAFVGKGVIFDTGGISIKPAGSMEDMKGDMGGGAAVVGAMKALALRKAKANVVGVIGIVENMPDGQAYRPGDILKSMSGQTIEVINTDAEGRLVLADALWYTQDRFKPRFMVDLATLTGAISITLGQEYAGLFSNSDELAELLGGAGIASGEKLWRLPIGAYYDKLIESRFADVKNSGGRLGNASTAAQFLSRFVNDVAWAHLDIAATAFGTSPSDVNSSWAPGYGVALLDSFVQSVCEKKLV